VPRAAFHLAKINTETAVAVCGLFLIISGSLGPNPVYDAIAGP